MGRPELRVTVAYCAPGVEDITELALPAGATVGDAIAASGVRERQSGIAATAPDVGIRGRPCGMAEPLGDGDRVELYRPLTVDPKEARRLRAEVRRRRARR